MPKPGSFRDKKPPRHFNAFKFKNQDEKGPKLGILSEEVMSYYRQVSVILENGFDDDDPSVKTDFLNNVYLTLKDEGIQVSQNQTVSRILELLFTHSAAHHLRGLFIQFCKELTMVPFDRFASHVFQALIQYLPIMYDDGDDEDEMSMLKTSIEKLCQFTESHLRDFMTHTYGSHVLRSLLEVLGGVPVGQEVIYSRVSRKKNEEKKFSASQDLSNDYKTCFMTLKDKLIRLCNYEDHLSDNNYCPVLQTMLLILNQISPSEYSELASTIITKTCPPVVTGPDEVDVTKRIPLLVQNEVGSYLMELLISLASEDQMKDLYKDVFKDKIIYFAVHPYANYVLQKLLTFSTEKEMFLELLDEIIKYLEDILAANHIGIVTKLVEACKRNHLGQEKVIKALMSAFHCEFPKERQEKIVPLIASMQTYEIMFPSVDKERINSGFLNTVIIHGSLILQQLVYFDNVKLLSSSLLELSPSELTFLCCDKSGSHVVDEFFQSPTVKEKSKDDFLKKLQGVYVNIACNRNGSRCLENIWKGSSLKRKTFIAEELLKAQERIESDQWGHFLYRNFALFKFSQRRREWIDFQNGLSKKKQLLQNILDGNVDKRKKKKRKKHEQQAQDDSQDKTATINEEDEPATDVTERHKQSKKRKVTQVVERSEEVDANASSKKKKKKKKDVVTEDVEICEEKDASQNESDSSVKEKKRKRKKTKRKILRGDNTEDELT